MENTSITIIVPTFNRGNLISECIDSIVNQYDDDWKLIIIDNNSSDNTPQICRSYEAKDRRIKYFRYNEHLPISDNWERGLNFVKTNYFTTFSDDDQMSSFYIQKAKEVLKNKPDILITKRFSYTPVDRETPVSEKLVLLENNLNGKFVQELDPSLIINPYLTAGIVDDCNLNLHPSMFIYSTKIMKNIIKNFSTFYHKPIPDFFVNTVAPLYSKKILFLNLPLISIGGLKPAPYCFKSNKLSWFGISFSEEVDSYLKKELKYLTKILILFQNYPYFKLNIIFQSYETLKKIRNKLPDKYSELISLFKKKESLIIKELIDSIRINYYHCLTKGDNSDNMIEILLGNRKKFKLNIDLKKYFLTLSITFLKLFKSNKAADKFILFMHNILQPKCTWIKVSDRGNQKVVATMNKYLISNYNFKQL